MVRPRWANMYTVKHGLPSVCQKQPFNHACYYLIVTENRLFLLLSATSPNFWSPNKKRQTFEVQRRLIAYLCKNILFSQPCKVALYRSKVTNWWLAFETLPKTWVLGFFQNGWIVFILPAHFVNLESVPTCFARWTTWTSTESNRLARRVICSTVRLIEGLILCVHV